METRTDRGDERRRMVERQVAARGVRSPRVLAALERVRRERYVPAHLAERAYDDGPLPIGEEQTISQPYVVALMADALELDGSERVLEIGTGSGYAAAVLAELADAVFTIERHGQLADEASRRLAREGYRRVHVRTGDGTLGWPEEAPFDAIVVAAGGPRVPDALREQLAVGGRLVIPVGTTTGEQQLLRVRRTGPSEFEEEALADVRFVPLVGAEGFDDGVPRPRGDTVTRPSTPRRTPAGLDLVERIARAAEPFTDVATFDAGALLARIGHARVVLLGEATHGTSEFYELRDRITRALVEHAGFRIVAIEGDWPDAARIDRHVRLRDDGRDDWRAFARFPTWMWRNAETRALVDWLHERAQRVAPAEHVRFAGLDLYSLYTSRDAVLAQLDALDPRAASAARERYACLSPWQQRPALYGRELLGGRHPGCEEEVLRVLGDLHAARLEHLRAEDERWFDALQNARVVAGAEHYYRAMYLDSAESWNLRDRHMADTLDQLLAFAGPDSRAVVFAHNSHVGDASATEMAARGELNLGQLCRERFGAAVYSIGMGTGHGTVAAASDWGGALETKRVRPALDGSIEALCHRTGVPRFLLPLRASRDAELTAELSRPRLERAIGVIYRPETERASHYFLAELARQFDEYVWLDETRAVRPLDAAELRGVPDTYPFGL